MSATRDQIISYLLQNDDNNQKTIIDLQKKLALLEKQLTDTKHQDVIETN